MEKLNISVVLPVESSKHKNFTDLFKSCIVSVQQQIKESVRGENVIDDIELVIIHSGEESLVELINNSDFSGLTTNIIHNEGDTDFSTQVNLGIEKSSHDWVTILEFDDEVSSIWFRNVYKYINAYPHIKGFLPIVVDTDENDTFAGFTNEATFAANMNSEIGILTNEVLLNYQNFQTSGMVFKKSIFDDFGGFKKSFKLTFVYELLLRLTYNSVEIMTIPRIGYKHSNMREGSIFWNYKNGEYPLTQEEVSFWIESAKKEHFFKDDRDIKYEVIDI
jgi:GT2 family glycosyltransferase